MALGQAEQQVYQPFSTTADLVLIHICDCDVTSPAMDSSLISPDFVPKFP